MRTECVSDNFRYNEYSATIFGLALNVLLTFLILFRTRDEFRSYSNILLLNCLIDVAFTISSCLIELVSDLAHCVRGSRKADLRRN